MRSPETLVFFFELCCCPTAPSDGHLLHSQRHSRRKQGCNFNTLLPIIQVFTAVYKRFVFKGLLQVCLNNMTPGHMPVSHATSLTLRPEEWSARIRAENRGTGFIPASLAMPAS